MKKQIKKVDKKPAAVHQDLKGFQIKINSFGELESSFKVEDLNRFLDQNKEKEAEEE